MTSERHFASSMMNRLTRSNNRKIKFNVKRLLGLRTLNFQVSLVSETFLRKNLAKLIFNDNHFNHTRRQVYES